MFNRFKKIWFGNGDMGAEFRQSGALLDHIQFCYRNVCGVGAKSKYKAIYNWIKQAIKEL